MSTGQESVGAETDRAAAVRPREKERRGRSANISFFHEASPQGHEVS